MGMILFSFFRPQWTLSRSPQNGNKTMYKYKYNLSKYDNVTTKWPTLLLEITIMPYGNRRLAIQLKQDAQHLVLYRGRESANSTGECMVFDLSLEQQREGRVFAGILFDRRGRRLPTKLEVPFNSLSEGRDTTELGFHCI